MPTACWRIGWSSKTSQLPEVSTTTLQERAHPLLQGVYRLVKFRAKKTPDFIWGGGSLGFKSGPLGRGPGICQHLTQHRSIERLHQPFSYSEPRFTDLVPKPSKLFAIVS